MERANSDVKNRSNGNNGHVVIGAKYDIAVAGARQGDTESQIGARLRAWRKASELTLMELSREISVSQSTLSELENSKALPSAPTLSNLCKHTNIDLYWLLTGEGLMVRNVEEPGGETLFSDEFLRLLKDKELRELMEKLIRICHYGGSEKRLHIEGFLCGADPGQP